MMKKLATAALMALAAHASAAAQDGDKDFEWEANIGVLSDYRDRGYSLSDNDFTVVGNVSTFHKSGFYTGVSAFAVDDRLGRDFKGDYYLGWALEKGPTTYDVAIEIDSIFGGHETRVFPELQASVSRDYGILYSKVGFAWAPEGRWNAPDTDTFYTYADLELPMPKYPAFTIISHIGYDVRNQRSNLVDWSVGVSAFHKNTEFTVAYEANSSNHTQATGAMIFGIRQYF